MGFTFPKTKTIIFLVAFVTLLIISRTYNLQKTARFIWDESSDLVNMHQIYVEKKVTLIGPISEDGSKVFGSLTYYMLLPFAIMDNFDPISTAYGAAFWGIITGILILFLIYKINKKLIYFAAPIILLWYPLVQTGRWAWNPNLIPFWITLSLIFYLRKDTFSKFISGFFMALAIHHHYLSIFTVAAFGVVAFWENYRNKDLKKFIIFTLGVIAAIAPFVIFDITHPPGLFLSRILYFNSLGVKISYIQSLYLTLQGTFFYLTQSVILEILLVISIILLLYYDISSRSKSLIYILPIIGQILGVSFVENFNTHYILPIIPFLIVYLIYPRNKIGKVLGIISISIILISSVLSYPSQITYANWEGNISATRYIANSIATEIKNSDLKNNNIAVLGSPDPNTYGRRYRDLLLIQNVILKTKGEYDISDHLFLITTSPLEAVRQDPAYEIKYFKSGKVLKSWTVPDSNWHMYLLNRS